MKAIFATAFAAIATTAAAHPGHGAPSGHAHWEIAAVVVVLALGAIAAWKLRA